MHGAIYVVDAADHARLEESRNELFGNSHHECLTGKPILVLANKQDLPSALPESDISAMLGLDQLLHCSHHVSKCVASAPRNGNKFDDRIEKGNMLNTTLLLMSKIINFVVDLFRY